MGKPLIHRDFDQSNVLVHHAEISAVLDFEFAGKDLRALDLAYAMSKWPGANRNTPKGWEIVETLVRGYFAEYLLAQEEIECIPAVLRLRAIASLYYFCGRFSKEIVPIQQLTSEVEETISDEVWLRENENEMAKRLKNISKRP